MRSKIILFVLVLLIFTVVQAAFSQNYKNTGWERWRLCRYRGETLTGYCACGKELIDRGNPQDLECVKIEPQFQRAAVFYNDPYAPAMDSTAKWGFINPYGDWVIDPVFDVAGVVVGGNSLVTLDNRTFTINIEKSESCLRLYFFNQI